MIYHIVEKENWDAQLGSKNYIHPSLTIEGFIHCSEESQVAGVLERYYLDKTDLLKLSIDPSLLTSELKYEVATGGEAFPHVFGPIDKSAIVNVAKI